MADDTVPDPARDPAPVTSVGPAHGAPSDVASGADDDTAPAALPPGAPRSPREADRLEIFRRRMQLPIVLSALIPLLVPPSSDGVVGAVVGVVTWLVFLFDLVVQIRHRVKYLRTGLGVFDLIVVIVTAPWYLIPGFGGARFALLLRLARLVRVLMVTRGARRLLDRLGRVTAMAGGVMVVASWIAYRAEHATNPGFKTFGDALWWGIVTLTTVGYGDIVPTTPTGRWAGVAIMLTGVATLGVLAGSMASFFRLTPEQEAQEEQEDREEAALDARLQAEMASTSGGPTVAAAPGPTGRRGPRGDGRRGPRADGRERCRPSRLARRSGGRTRHRTTPWPKRWPS